MKEIGIEEIKQIQFDMLCAIHGFCVKNDIQYSLAYGTLLGAIRHKGFIPWDDDIDIMMTRPNYNKFMSLFKHDYIEAVCFEKNKNYPFNYGKAFDRRTILKEQIPIDFENSIFIDIFCIDGVGDDLQVAKKHCELINKEFKVLQVKQICYSSKRPFSRNLLLFVSKTIVSFVPYKRLLTKIINDNTIYKYEDSTFVCDLCWGDKNLILPKSLYETYDTVEFEGFNFYAIKEWNVFLRKAYGDYMQLPPLDKRVSHHAFEAFWKM